MDDTKFTQTLMKKYSADEIIVNKWARLVQTLDGKWRRVWKIEFQQKITPKIDLENISQELSEEDFEIQIKKISNNIITVDICTKRHGADEQVRFLTYKLFEKLENKITSINSIENQKMKERWSPYGNK